MDNKIEVFVNGELDLPPVPEGYHVVEETAAPVAEEVVEDKPKAKRAKRAKPVPQEPPVVDSVAVQQDFSPYPIIDSEFIRKVKLLNQVDSGVVNSRLDDIATLFRLRDNAVTQTAHKDATIMLAILLWESIKL